MDAHDLTMAARDAPHGADVDPLVAEADARRRRLPEETIPLSRLHMLIIGAVLCAILAVLTVIMWIKEPFVATLIAGILLVVLVLWVWGLRVLPRKSWERCWYREGSDALEIRTGIWWARLATVPHSRIQHVDVNQGPLQRKFGLATLNLHTAGTHNANIELWGLHLEDAVAMRDRLMTGVRRDGV